jgi:hypothetical protein
MSYRVLLLATLLFIVAATGCHKDASSASPCEALKAAMINTDKEQARLAITAMIDRLPSKEYTEAGLGMLSNSISGQCGMNAGVFCFNCIKTLPSETEIEISFISSGSPVQRTIDISYTPQNEMRFVNIR